LKHSTNPFVTPDTYAGAVDQTPGELFHMSQQHINKVVLAYSGGLDTSVIVPWLRQNYHCEVICFSANIGQQEELDGLEEKALKSGASKLIVRDLHE
jgi:argininosuccinate synthase